MRNEKHFCLFINARVTNLTARNQGQSLKIRCGQQKLLLQHIREKQHHPSHFISLPLLFFSSPYLQYPLLSLSDQFSLSLSTQREATTNNNKYNWKKKHGNSTHLPIPSKHQRVHSLSSMAQLDQNLCKKERKKEKQKRNNRMWNKKKGKFRRCLQMSSNQTQLTLQSLSLSHRTCSPKYPSARPQKIPSSSLSFKRTIFFTELCGLFGFLCLGQSFTEKTGKREPSYLFLSLLFLSFVFSY